MRTHLKPLPPTLRQAQGKLLLRASIPLGLFLGSLAVGYIALAWTAPGSNPPANNVLPPLNISGNAQYKTGNLYLGAASSSPFTLNVQANGADLASLWVDNGTVLNGATNVNSNLSVGVSGGSTQICLNGNCITDWPKTGISSVTCVDVGPTQAQSGGTYTTGNQVCAQYPPANSYTCVSVSGGGECAQQTDWSTFTTRCCLFK